MDRNTQIDSFLAEAGLTQYTRTKIPGDASFRHYERIQADKDYILMDAPPEKEDVKPFIKVDEILIELGLSAPEIIAKDVEKGFLLLEDFGSDKFNKLFQQQPQDEKALYRKAVDVLVHIYKYRQKFYVPPYTRAKLISEAQLLTDWYLPLFEKFDAAQLKKIGEDFTLVMDKVLAKIKLPNDVIVLRDYHADNLMLLKDRSAEKQVGLLDFQDALMGNVAYDLVSLLEDARRDVPKEIQTEMLDYFIARTGLNRDRFLNDYYILGAQRNLKIIGIFSRLKVRDGKDVYLPLIPRVKEYLKHDLEHESLIELKEFLNKTCNL